MITKLNGPVLRFAIVGLNIVLDLLKWQKLVSIVLLCVYIVIVVHCNFYMKHVYESNSSFFQIT